MTELALSTSLTAQQRNHLTIVKDSANSLLSILNDILDFSKIEAGRLELEAIPMSIREVVEDAARLMAVPAARKGLELVCDVDPKLPKSVIGDPSRLRQIILNLVGNALKFTERGEVVVKVSAAEAQALAHSERCYHFDLSREPLCRIRLLHETGSEPGEAGDYVLLVTMHHSVSDGWSLGIFFRELMSL